MIRYPSVAGMFYPGDRESLNAELRKFIQVGEKSRKVMGLISPHAGYVYSGSCAGKGFGAVQIPDRVIILGVNHRGIGHPLAIDGNGKWKTPLGEIGVDDRLRDELLGAGTVFGVDSGPASDEHSLEVQVPFIQYLNKSAVILPITVGTHDREMIRRAGIELAAMIKNSEYEILMVASTDMSHYVSADHAENLDMKAIEKIRDLDPDGLFDTVYSNGISMCGVAPTYIAMTAAKALGATGADVVEYTHSGYTSGDFDQVVGYLSATIN